VKKSNYSNHSEDKTEHTCLVIEDTSITREILRILLTKLGFVVSDVPDAMVGLDLCAGGMPDLVLVDWNLPGIDGIEFVSRMRKLPGGASPKVVMCTIENDLTHIQRALANGADEYLMKPFNLEVLARKLDSLGFPVDYNFHA